MKRWKKHNRRRTAPIALLTALVTAALLAGCGASSPRAAISAALDTNGYDGAVYGSGASDGVYVSGMAAANGKAAVETAAAAELIAKGGAAGDGALSAQELELAAQQGDVLDNAAQQGDVSGNAAQQETSGGDSGAKGAESSREKGDAETASGETAQPQRKLVKTVNLSVETQALDSLDAAIAERAQSLGGYVENVQRDEAASLYEAEPAYRGADRRQARTAYYTVRVPQERLDEFVQMVGETANVTSRGESVRDITLQYVDADSRKQALLTEQERLMELLEQAQSVTDIVAIEEQLTQVRYELQNMESQLRLYDNQVNYATVTLDVTEVRAYSPAAEAPTWEKLHDGFLRSAENLLADLQTFGVWFVVNLPYILFWIAVVAVACLLLRLVIFLCTGGRRDRERPAKPKRLKGDKRRGGRGAAGEQPAAGTGGPTPQAGNPWEKQ